MYHLNRGSLTLFLFCPVFSLVILLQFNALSTFLYHRSSEHSCRMLIFRGNGCSFSSFNIVLSTGLWYAAFIKSWYILSIPIFFRDFIKKECWTLTRDFFFISSCDFYARLFLSCITFICLCILNQPWVSGINWTRLWYMILMYSWIWLSRILLRICVYMFITEIGL